MILSPDIEARIAEAIAFRLNPIPWVGSDGRTKHDVSKMESSHIHNCIRMIQDARIRRPKTSGLTSEQWLAIFENELLARDYKSLYLK